MATYMPALIPMKKHPFGGMVPGGRANITPNVMILERDIVLPITHFVRILKNMQYTRGFCDTAQANLPGNFFPWGESFLPAKWYYRSAARRVANTRIEESMRFTERRTVLACAAAMTVALCSCSSEAPNFSLKTAEGKTIELRNFQGKVVVINFWASWCPPCRSEIPGLLEVYRKYRPKGLEIVGISLDSDGWRKVSPLVRDMNIDYPVVMGNDDVVHAYGGIRAIPTTIIIDKEGKIIDRVIGFLDRQRFEDEVLEAMNS